MPKHVWRIAVLVCAVLSFFGLAFWPKDMSALQIMMQRLDYWIYSHAAYPSLFALIVGFGIGTILLPNIWHAFKWHFFPPKPRADSNGAPLLQEILAKSKRAKLLVNNGLLTTPLMYETHLTQTGIIEKRLEIQIVDEIHDRLRAGEITAWGTPDGKKPHQKIEPHEWSEIELSAGHRELKGTLPAQLHAVYRKNGIARQTAFGYVWIKFSRTQTLKEFPLAWFPRRKSNEPHEKEFTRANI